MLNAAQENPLFEPDAVTHHGGFFQAQLALDLDGASLAVAQAATNAHALLRVTNEPAFTGLRPFLASGPQGASGLMMLEYTAAAALAEIRNAASPASLGTLALSRGAEEDASFATQGGVQFERAVDSYRTVLACQALAVSRLLWQAEVEVPAASSLSSSLAWSPSSGLSPALADAADAVRGLQKSQEDQDLREPLRLAAALLDELALGVAGAR